MRFFVCILLAAFWAQGTLAIAQEEATQEKAIGIIKIAEGDSFVIKDETPRAAKTGEAVFQKDVLQTGSNGTLGVTLKDNTRLSLGPDSRLTLNEFTFNPGQKEYSFITEITRGTLMYLSGMMSKLSPESVSVKTPVATVGIRGTRFLIRIDDEENTGYSELSHPTSSEEVITNNN